MAIAKLEIILHLIFSSWATEENQFEGRWYGDDSISIYVIIRGLFRFIISCLGGTLKKNMYKQCVITFLLILTDSLSFPFTKQRPWWILPWNCVIFIVYLCKNSLKISQTERKQCSSNKLYYSKTDLIEISCNMWKDSIKLPQFN